MAHGKEQGLHHTAGSVPGSVPPGKRYRSFRSQQTTPLFYTLLLAALLMFDGVFQQQFQTIPKPTTRNLTGASENRNHYRQRDRNPLFSTDRYSSYNSNSSSKITRVKMTPVTAETSTGHKSTAYLPVASPEKTTPRTNNGSNLGTTEPTAQSILVIPLAYGPTQTTAKSTVKADVCWRHDCRDLATETLSKMSTAVDPCDNFYGFACGGFVKNTKIPAEKNMENTFTKFDDILQEQMISSVKSMYTNLNLPFRTASQLYERCMNTNRIEAEGNKTLLDILVSWGGWPVLEGESWDYKEASSWTWEQSMKNNRKQGYSIDSLFDFSVEEDLKNVSRRILYVDQPSLSVSREDFAEGWHNPNVEAYLKSMINAAAFLGANTTHVGPVLKDLLDFETNLARVTLPKEVRRNATAMYNPMSVKDFQSKYNFTNWIDYFNSMLKYAAITIDENETINVRAPSYFGNLSTLLQAPTRTIANYVVWRVVQFSSPFLTKQMRKTVLSTKYKHDNRTKECADITIKRLPLVVETSYDKTLIDDTSKKNVLVIANETRKEFMNILSKVDWMDRSTRIASLETINRTTFHIGHTAEPMDDDKLTKYYYGLEFNATVSYLSTVLYIDKFSTTKKFKELRQSVNKPTTYLDPVGVEIHHSISENSIRFAPYYVQKPFFSYFWPEYMKYGVMGSVIGRAIARNFVDQRWHFDRIGIPTNWCHTDMEGTFVKQTFSVLNQHVRQNSDYDTVAEKITDIGGVLLAYQAYQKKNGTDELLPNLNLTADQMFWLSAAQAWCSVYRPEAIDMCITKGSTSPDQFRVIEPMRNLVEFSSDFYCTFGSRMNPVEKSRLW